MSLATFKKKSVIQYGSNISAKPMGAYWLPQGPFGPLSSTNSVMLRSAIAVYGPVGFSLNGTHRNVGRVGQSMRMSKNGTPFRGVHARGSGGIGGRYPRPEPTFNAGLAKIEVMGNQHEYNKPSTLSTRGMLRKKYKYIYNGQYPNYWVQPNYGSSNLKDNASQGVYIHTKSAANDCVVDVNNFEKYIGHVKLCGPMQCRTANGGRYTYNTMAMNAPYTKQLYQPQTSSQHTLHVQRKCSNPLPGQKPYPYAVNGDACLSTYSVDDVRVPEWYVTDKYASSRDLLKGNDLINSLTDKITDEELFALLNT